MKKIISLILTVVLCLSLGACAGDNSQEKLEGPYIDVELIDLFPFISTLDDVQQWFEANDNYEIERVDELNNEVVAVGKGTPKWRTTAISGVYGYKGFLVSAFSTLEVSTEEIGVIYEGILAELNALCGEPTNVWLEGDGQSFYFEGKTIKVLKYDDYIELTMGYNLR